MNCNETFLIVGCRQTNLIDIRKADYSKFTFLSFLYYLCFWSRVMYQSNTAVLGYTFHRERERAGRGLAGGMVGGVGW